MVIKLITRRLVSLMITFLPMAALAECDASSAEVSALNEHLRTAPVLMAQSTIDHGRTNFLGIAGILLSVSS